MAFSKKFGSTEIKKGRIDNLGISWGYDIDPKKRFPILFFTPDMTDTNTHYHIQLTTNQARVLKKWLDEFLRENEKLAATKAKKPKKR